MTMRPSNQPPSRIPAWSQLHPGPSRSGFCEASAEQNPERLGPGAVESAESWRDGDARTH